MNSFSHKYAIRMGSSPINFSFNVFSFVRTDPEHMVMPIKPSSVYISNLARDLERVVTIEFQNGFSRRCFTIVILISVIFIVVSCIKNLNM